MLIEWIKVGHIVAMISWMAGLLYLPRLMVYHAGTEPGSDQSEGFKIMERRLFRMIMLPAILATWLFGLWLAYLTGTWIEGWFWIKIICVILMSAFHEFCGVWTRELARDERRRTQRFFRIANEIPTGLMIIVVIMVVVRPF